MPEGRMSVERRAYPRLSVKIPVKYRVVDDKKVMKSIEDWRQAEHNAYTLDLSLGGMHLVLDQPLKVGTILDFDLHLPEKTNIVKVYAEVVWANKEGAGIKFLMTKPSDMKILGSYLSKPGR